MPLSRITFLNRSLSIASADAATPAPTYGTSASSSSPCTVPSSPNGPWRIGRTTSTTPSVSSVPLSAGTGSVSAGPSRFSYQLGGSPAPAPSGRRGRSPISAISYRSGSRAAATERADAREISCSLERPPARMATRRRRAGLTRVVVVVGGGGRRRVLPDHDRHRRALRRLGVAGRVLGLDDVVLARVGHDAYCWLTWKPAAWRSCSACCEVSPTTAARSSAAGRSRAEVNGSALRLRRTGRRIL